LGEKERIIVIISLGIVISGDGQPGDGHGNIMMLR
jgi:hypothetical protein